MASTSLPSRREIVSELPKPHLFNAHDQSNIRLNQSKPSVYLNKTGIALESRPYAE